jgi:TolB-like protein/tetratricopeptide (TPR) repeat protein
VAAAGPRPALGARGRAWVALGTGAVVAIAVGYLLVARPWRPHGEAVRDQSDRAAPAHSIPASPTAREKSIAVLPFLDMSEKRDQEYFSDGLSEELINRLTQIQDLRVPARTSSFYFKGQHATLAEIAKALNVSHVLEGSVRKAGNTLRITAQLVRTDNGYHVWSQTFDRPTTDIFKVQDEIAQAVVAALRVNLSGPRPTGDTETENMAAYDLLLEGRFFETRNAEGDPERAVAAYRRALEADPTYALAWTELAWTLLWDVAHPDFERSRHAALKAVELRPDLAQTHATLGWINSQLIHDWAAAEAEFDEALALEPSNMRALWGKGELARVLKRPDESVRYYRAALERDPMSAHAAQGFSTTLIVNRRLAEAEAQARRALEISPGMYQGHFYVGHVLLEKGDAEAALREMRLETSPHWRRFGIALTAYRAGQRAEADATLADMLKLDADTFPFAIASVYAFRGEAGPAVTWLERARAGHFGSMDEISTLSFYDPIRNDARFIAFLREMKLP